MQNYFNSKDLLVLVKKRWKNLLFIGVISFFITLVFSGPQFIVPKYKSIAIVYPVNISPYSDESETEQLLQLFFSEDVKKEIIKKFALASHYEIDTTTANGKKKLRKRFNKNLNIRRTEFESIEIEIHDRNPQTAYLLVNEYIDLVSGKIRKLHKKNYKEILDFYFNMLEYKQKEIDSLEKRIQYFTKNYHLYNQNAQSEEVVKGDLGTVSHSNVRNIDKKAIAELKQNLEKYGHEYRKCSDFLYVARNHYLEIKRKYDEALNEYNKNFSYCNVISSPEIPYKKFYPKRMLIVFSATLSALVFALLLFAFFDGRKK